MRAQQSRISSLKIKQNIGKKPKYFLSNQENHVPEQLGDSLPVMDGKASIFYRRGFQRWKLVSERSEAKLV